MPEVDRTDAEIIASSCRDPECFGLLFRRHNRAIYTFAARRVGPDDAADVVAEVFRRSFSNRRRYDFEKPDARPWLYGIASNVIGDLLRRRARSERIYLAPQVIADADYADADDRIAAETLRARLNDALSRLTDKDRETLLMYALEGLSYAEIGRALRIPPGTVGSRLNRARSKLLEAIPDLELRTWWEADRDTGAKDE